MCYAMGLPTNEAALEAAEWSELFDFVICSSQKPDFYAREKPFRHWNIPFNAAGTSYVTAEDFRREAATSASSAVFVNGSAKVLTDTLQWEGRDVLYCGDNLRTDLVEARRRHGWKTACIINELGDDIEIRNTTTFLQLYFNRSTIRALLTELQALLEREAVMQADSGSDNVDLNDSIEEATKYNHLTAESLEAELNWVPPKKRSVSFSEEENVLIRTLESQLHGSNSELSLLFNKQFGGVFRTDGHLSLFAFAVRRYADLYMNNVCNLADYNPSHRFYPPRAAHMVS